MAKMAKRGRPKLDVAQLKHKLEESYGANDRLRMEIRDLSAKLVEQKAMLATLDYQYHLLRLENDANKGSAERCQELLAEIRMYEHETSTLRYIIIDALRQKD